MRLFKRLIYANEAKFFFRNKHMMCDFGTGNNNKLNWVLEDKQELIDIIETIYRGAKKGRGLVVSPKGESYHSLLKDMGEIGANGMCRLFYPLSVLDRSFGQVYHMVLHLEVPTHP